MDPEPGPAPLAGAEPAEPEAEVEPDVQPAGVPGAGPVAPVEPDSGAGTVEPLDLVELALASVELSPEGLMPATGTVSLVALAGGGQLDIVMARPDAVLVQEAISGIPPLRPRTHDLLLAVVDALAGAVTGVTLVERRAGGVYVANLAVRGSDGSTVQLDARPSDALNVALRSIGAVLRADRALIDVPAN